MEVMTRFLLCWTLIILLQLKSTLLLSNAPSCGVPKIHKTALIVSGSDTETGAWPWHAAIFHRNGRNVNYVCGGTLISEVFVLTAGHCVISEETRYQLAVNLIFVRLGVYNLDEINPETIQQHSVQKIHQPENFTSESLRNDIALLELASIAQFNDYVQPACLSSTKDLTGQFGTAIGWGVTEDDKTSPILKKAQMPVIDPVTCLASNRDLFGVTLDESIFCAGYTNGTSVCNGDSGGGIFFNKDNVWYLGGIVSFTESRSPYNALCNTRGYAGFTKVYAFLRWITSITKTRNDIEEETLQPETDESPCEPRGADASAKYTNLLPRNCGVYVDNRLEKGQKAKVFEYPWMATFIFNEYSSNTARYFAGSLIHSRYVLTTASSVTIPILPLIGVRLGEHTMEQDRDCNELNGERGCDPPVRTYGIECIITHQNYSDFPHPNDIALVRLDRDVLFESHIQPICLPVTPELRKLRLPQYIVTVTIWGWTGLHEDFSNILLKITLPPANRSMCEQFVYYQLEDSQLCVGDANGGNKCLGDNGGPLGAIVDYNNEMRFVQYGIFSSTPACGAKPSIYTSTVSFMDWIMANVRP